VGDAFFLLHPASVEGVAWISELWSIVARVLVVAMTPEN